MRWASCAVTARLFLHQSLEQSSLHSSQSWIAFQSDHKMCRILSTEAQSVAVVTSD